VQTRHAGPVPFDCKVGIHSLQGSWSPAKRTFCCRTVRRGCAVQETGPGATTGFNCNATGAEQLKAWSFAQRRWCCMNEDKGCPPGLSGRKTQPLGSAPAAHVAAAPTAGNSAPAPGIAKGCGAVCSLGGFRSTCGQHLRSVAAKAQLAGVVGTCAAAQTQIQQRCPVCAACTPAIAKCVETRGSAPAQAVPSQAPPAPAPATLSAEAQTAAVASTEADGDCGPSCVLDGKNISCRQHAQAVASRRFGHESNGCLLAATFVRERCKSCPRCSAVAAGCGTWLPEPSAPNSTRHGAGPSKPAGSSADAESYDCDEGIADFARIWSLAKKAWCCRHRHRGCPPSVNYDCDAGYENWEMGWSLFKKAWCCQHHFKGCPEKNSE